MDPLTPGAAAQRPARRRALGIVLALAACGGAFALCQAFLVTVFVVSGTSMEPTLHDGERVLVLRAFGAAERGDLLVFRNPNAPEEVLVKRVLALPGERISVVDGCVRIDERELAEPYAKPGTAIGRLAPTAVPQGAYFLVGDNRGESVDSRRLGPVEARLVVGKVLLRLAR